EIRPQPHRDATFRDPGAGFGIHEGSAAGCKDDRPFLQEACDDAPLAVPEMLLAVNGEDVGDRHARRRLDLVIGVAEGQPELLREPAAHGALTGPHEADEHDGSRAKLAGDRVTALAVCLLLAAFIERIEAADVVHGSVLARVPGHVTRTLDPWKEKSVTLG